MGVDIAYLLTGNRSLPCPSQIRRAARRRTVARRLPQQQRRSPRGYIGR